MSSVLTQLDAKRQEANAAKSSTTDNGKPGGSSGHVIMNPEFDAGGCAVSFIEVAFSAAVGHVVGVAFGAAGMWFACR